MENSVHIWHYLVMIAGFATCAALLHLVVGLTNGDFFVFALDFGFLLALLNPDTDENGQYELYSAKNLLIFVIFGTFGGLACVLCVPGFGPMLAGWIDAMVAFTGDLFWYRIEHFRWI